MAFALSGSIITQSGTDTSLAGLSSIAGVTTTTVNGRSIYNIGTLRISVTGTLTISPRTEMIIAGTPAARPLFYAGASTANLTIGSSVTQNGAKVFTTLPWLVTTVHSGNPSVFNLQDFNWQQGTFTWHEGTFVSASGASWGAGTRFDSESSGAATITINEGAAIQGVGGPSEVQFHIVERNAIINGLRVFGLNDQDVKLSLARLRTPPKINLNGSYGLTSFTAALRNEFLTLRDYSGTAMFGDARFWDGCRLRFVNSALGTGHIVREHITAGSRQGIAEFRQELTINTKTSAGAAIGGSVSYLKDVTNVNRVNYTFTNPNINYTPDNVYIIAHNATTGVGTYTTDGGVLVGVVARTTDGSTFPFDRRGNEDASTDLFTIHTWNYGFLYTTNTRSLKGNGGTNFDAVMIQDTNVTLSESNARSKLTSSFIVDLESKTITVTANSTYDDVYDILKAYKCQTTQAALEAPAISRMLVTANGRNLTMESGWSIIVMPGTILTSGNKFSFIYADNVNLLSLATAPYLFNSSGVLQGTGVLVPTTVLNVQDTYTGSGLITAVYGNLVGTSTIWEFGSTSAPITAGTSLAIYDASGTTKYYNAVTTSGVYRYYIPPQAVGEPYTYAIEKYGTRRETGTFPSNNGGVLFYVPSYTEDVGITETNQATVNAWVDLSGDSTRIYDAVALYRLSEAGIKSGQIVTRDGTSLRFEPLNVVVDDQAANKVSLSSGTLTLKALTINSTTKFDKLITSSNKTIVPVNNELLNITIEDANGDSVVSIVGGDGTYELWKIPTTTATDDYATGVKLTNPTIGNTSYRFIGITGFDIVGRDVSSGVRRRSSMAKGVYTQSFYVGDQIQLANNSVVDEIKLIVDEILVKENKMMGPGFSDATDSLEKISDKVDLGRTNLEVVNNNVKKASRLIPASQNIQ